MAYPWDILDISAKNADVNAVKRAYAKQLKNCRPDDDPEGFQIVLKARDQALWLLENLDIITAHHQEIAERQVVGGGVVRQHGSNAQRVLTVEHVASDHCILASEEHLKAAPEDLSHSYFEKELENRKQAKTELWDLSSWEIFLNQLNQAHFSCRQDIEWLVIDYIGERLLKHRNILANPAEKENIFAVLLLLNEAFGWDSDDKKVYHVLGNSNADFLLGLMRSNLFNKQALIVSKTQNKRFIPYIATPDLRAYMGGEGEDIIHDYLWAWRQKKWQHSFNWSGFLLGYIWQAWRSFWLVGLGILSLQLFVLAHFAKEIMVSPLTKVLVITGLIVIPLLMIARYGNYWVIQAAYKVIKKSENKAFNNAMERYDFLQRAGQGNFLLLFVLIVTPIILGIFLSYFL